ncbi:MAG: hypothetical protein KJ060_01115 [Candidatus Hydrogenedentes bacterium]|nr:hypothetical protein [Candidatus Hydrogenedentota bacterium]
MLDDLIESLIEDLPVGPGNVSKRAQVLFRLFFGVLGALLGVAGMVKFIVDPPDTANTAMWISMLAVFFFLACFCLFNVAFLRRWRWPGVMFLISLVMLFVTRIAFGA